MLREQHALLPCVSIHTFSALPKATPTPPAAPAPRCLYVWQEFLCSTQLGFCNTYSNRNRVELGQVWAQGGHWDMWGCQAGWEMRASHATTWKFTSVQCLSSILTEEHFSWATSALFPFQTVNSFPCLSLVLPYATSY